MDPSQCPAQGVLQPPGEFRAHSSKLETPISMGSEQQLLESVSRFQFNRSSMASMLANSFTAQSIENKPRLGKDEVDILEREFKKNPKPTTQTKRQLAEDMCVELPRVNVIRFERRPKSTLLTGVELVPEPSSQAEAGKKASGIRDWPSSIFSRCSRASRRLT